MTPAPDRPIAIVGYRGTGKSTVGRLLASALQRPWIDLDEALETELGQPIAEFFRTAGEAAFRDREADLLARNLAGWDPAGAPHPPAPILGTGGGIVIRPENRERIRRACMTIWLTAPAEVIAARLETDPTSGPRRPALTTLPPQAEIEALLAARSPWYAELAEMVQPTEARSPEAVVAAILASWASSNDPRKAS